jgi:hypothetical protein
VIHSVVYHTFVTVIEDTINRMPTPEWSLELMIRDRQIVLLDVGDHDAVH